MVKGLASDNYRKLYQQRRKSEVLKRDLEELRNSAFYFIKTIDSKDITPVYAYINLLGLLHDLTEDIHYMTKLCHRHTYNNHRKISNYQHDELLTILFQINFVFNMSVKAFENKMSNEAYYEKILSQKQASFELLQEKIQNQIVRTKEIGTSIKNTSMYFNLLLRTKDLIAHMFQIIEEYEVMANKRGA